MTRCHVLTPRPDLQRQIRRFGDHTMDLGIVLTHPAAVQPVFKRRREHPMDLRTVMIRVPDVRSRFRRCVCGGGALKGHGDRRDPSARCAATV